MSARYRIGVDIGGTFTDLVVEHGQTGELVFGKTLTTHADPAAGVESVITEVLTANNIALADVDEVVHGTTLVTNALIERRGATTALLTTDGFRDVLEIRRENRYELYDLRIENPRPLVPRERCYDIRQRVYADGSRAIDLDEEQVRSVARQLVADGVEAVAVSYLHAYADGSDERRTRELLAAEAPALRVSLSSDVVPEIREFERATTTIANVYVQGLVETYLASLADRLQRMGFGGQLYIMLSSGGIATPHTASTFPIRMLESGPAGGALAAARFGVASGHPTLLSFDMGGTTAKLCVIVHGEPTLTSDFEVDRVYRFKKGSGMPVRTPVIEMIEIGAGGGSMARVDSLGLLSVGPESAGSEPGPVCYGRGGTQPTVTDADLLLGYLNPVYFLGGSMQLDADTCAAAMHTVIARPLGLDVIDAAWGVHTVVNENMASAARVAAVERGLDPATLPLFAFGGAGPVHACRVALALGSPRVVIPSGAGVMSADGFLDAPLAFDFVRTMRNELESLQWERVNDLFGSMEAEGVALLGAAGVSAALVVHRRLADARYVGQGFDIRIDVPTGRMSPDSIAEITTAFERRYRQLYGRLGPSVPIEIVALRVVSSVERARPTVRPPSSPVAAEPSTRLAWFPEAGGFVDTPVWSRYSLATGDGGDGPAIIEERESTLVVPPGGRWSVAADRSLDVTFP